MPDAYKVLSAVCEKYRIHSLNPLFDAISNLQNQKNFINVSVLGQFKAGKSSFINCLIGKSLLPVASTPLTNVITTVQWGEKERGIIYRNKIYEEIDLKELVNFISEEKNPENIKNIENAIVESPGLKRMNRLKFIDTPGLGSIFNHNSSITANWLPNTGISFILISCTQPLSENDLKLIEETIHFGPEIVIILTKTDLIDKSDIKNLKSFVSVMLRKKFGKDFPVFEYSVKREEYKNEILQNLLFPLNNDFKNKNVRILNYKLNSLRRQCLNYLDIALQSSLKKKEGEFQLKEKILDEKLNKPVILKELDLIAKSYTTGTREQLKTYLLSKYKTALTLKAENDFGKEYFSWKGNLNKVSRSYESWFKEFVLSQLKSILVNDKEIFNEILAEAKNHYEQYLQFFRERLNNRILNTLNVKLKTENGRYKRRRSLVPISLSDGLLNHILICYGLSYPCLYLKKFSTGIS